MFLSILGLTAWNFRSLLLKNPTVTKAVALHPPSYAAFSAEFTCLLQVTKYEEAVRSSWVWEELSRVRNFKPASCLEHLQMNRVLFAESQSGVEIDTETCLTFLQRN